MDSTNPVPTAALVETLSQLSVTEMAIPEFPHLPTSIEPGSDVDGSPDSDAGESYYDTEEEEEDENDFTFTTISQKQETLKTLFAQFTASTPAQDLISASASKDQWLNYFTPQTTGEKDSVMNEAAWKMASFALEGDFKAYEEKDRTETEEAQQLPTLLSPEEVAVRITSLINCERDVDVHAQDGGPESNLQSQSQLVVGEKANAAIETVYNYFQMYCYFYSVHHFIEQLNPYIPLFLGGKMEKIRIQYEDKKVDDNEYTQAPYFNICATATKPKEVTEKAYLNVCDAIVKLDISMDPLVELIFGEITSTPIEAWSPFNTYECNDSLIDPKTYHQLTTAHTNRFKGNWGTVREHIGVTLEALNQFYGCFSEDKTAPAS